MKRNESIIGRSLRIDHPPMTIMVGQYVAPRGGKAPPMPSFRVKLRIVRHSKYNRDGSKPRV